MLLPSLLDKVVVVTDADVLPLYVGKFLAGTLRREGFEITLPRRTWRKQNQHRCGLVGLILEAMHSTFRDKQKISCDRVDPTFAVEQLHHAGDNEKRFGHGSVEVRAGPRRVGFRIPPIQAEFSPCRCSGRQIAHSSPRADRQLGFLARRTVERADLTRFTLIARIGIGHPDAPSKLARSLFEARGLIGLRLRASFSPARTLRTPRRALYPSEHRQTELVRPGAGTIDLSDGITPFSMCALGEQRRPAAL